MRQKVKSILRPYLYSPEVILNEQFAYGAREIYQRFINFDPKKIIFAEVQHGWYLDSSWTSQSIVSNRQLNRRLKRYPLLVWSREIAQELNNPKFRSVYAVTSPWSLLLSSYEKLKSRNLVPTYNEIPGSALYFPTHSFHGMKAFLDSTSAQNILKSQNFSSITTSLFWIDFINPHIREQFESFSKVTCMGIRAPAATETPWSDIGGRRNFLYQLHKAISEHQFIICDEFSTAAMAALTLGKQVFITKDKVNWQLIHRSEKNPILELDNFKIISKFGLNKSEQGLGYNLSDNRDILELAKRGFGFDISIEETHRILERFLGNPSLDLQNKEITDPRNNLLW